MFGHQIRKCGSLLERLICLAPPQQFGTFRNRICFCTFWLSSVLHLAVSSLGLNKQVTNLGVVEAHALGRFDKRTSKLCTGISAP